MNAPASVTANFTALAAGLSVTPATLTFDNVYFGTARFQQVMIANTGTSSLPVGVSLKPGTGPFAGNFTLVNLCPRGRGRDWDVIRQLGRKAERRIRPAFSSRSTVGFIMRAKRFCECVNHTEADVPAQN